MIINSIGSGGGGVKLPVMTTPASPDKVLAGYETIGQDGTIQVGTIQTVGLPEPSIEFDSVAGIITAAVTGGPGYLDEEATKTTTFEIPIVDIATPTVSIDENGLIKATQIQTKGYIAETGSASATMQLQVRTSDDLILDDDGKVTAPAGYYPQAAEVTAAVEPTIAVSTGGLITATAGSKEVTHQITKNDIPTLLPGNIRSGVNIAGVVGTVTGGVVTYVTVSTGVSGAVVTAKCGTTTQTATCNYSGVATVYLTMAGTWTISAAHPTNGAYSTNDASVQVQNNFPITLAVGSSTTVSATGRYTATLNMAYRPAITNDYKYQSHWGLCWTMAAVTRYTDSDTPYFMYVSGLAKDGKIPVARSYSTNASGGSPGNFTAAFSYYYINSGSSYSSDYTPQGSYFGVTSGRWGGAAAELRYNGATMAVFTGGYSPCPDEGGYMQNVDMFIRTNNSYFCVCGSYSYRGSGDDSFKATDPNCMAMNLTTGRAWHAASGYRTDIPYVLIAGGQTNSGGSVTASVETVYVTSLSVNPQDVSVAKGTASNLSVARSYLAGVCHMNDYILFAGGKNASGTPVANVDAYSNTRVKSTPTALSVARYGLAAAIAAGTFAVFAGGVSGNGVSNVVDAYNLSRVRTTPVTLSVARHDMAGITMGDYAVFAGGRTSISSGASNVVDMIGPNMVRTTATMHYAKYGCRGCGGTNPKTNSYEAYIFGGFNASGDVAGYYERLSLPTT